MTQTPGNEEKEIEDFHQSDEWYKQHKPEILRQYEGMYIAVTGNPPKIVDYDMDRIKLSDRMHKSGRRHLYMPFVIREEPVIDMGGPKDLI